MARMARAEVFAPDETRHESTQGARNHKFFVVALPENA